MKYLIRSFFSGTEIASLLSLFSFLYKTDILSQLTYMYIFFFKSFNMQTKLEKGMLENNKTSIWVMC